MVELVINPQLLIVRHELVVDEASREIARLSRLLQGTLLGKDLSPAFLTEFLLQFRNHRGVLLDLRAEVFPKGQQLLPQRDQLVLWTDVNRLIFVIFCR